MRNILRWLPSKGPFIFTGNASTVTTPGTQKPKFDLKASLSRPLTYKPHTGTGTDFCRGEMVKNATTNTSADVCILFKGKLKPFGDAKENASANKSLVTVSSHQKNYKQHQARTRFVLSWSRPCLTSTHRFPHTVGPPWLFVCSFREDRRAEQAKDRKQKKEGVLGARRGLVMM